MYSSVIRILIYSRDTKEEVYNSEEVIEERVIFEMHFGGLVGFQ